METIVQLKQSEYEKLVSDAELNKTKIEERADLLYQKNGTYKIVLQVRTEEYDDEIHLKANSYVNDWDSKYPLEENDAKKIIKFVNRKAEDLFRKSFGEVIYNLEKLKKKNTKIDNIIRKNLIITVTGWLLAITLVGLFAYFA